MSSNYDLFKEAASSKTSFSDKMSACRELQRRKENGSFTRRDLQDIDDRLKKERNYESNNSSSDCFITTAVCTSFGKPDDCFELMSFRNFRDNWLMNQPDGNNLIQEYYRIAPAIVSKIDKMKDAAKIYKDIWNDYLVVCLQNIENGKFAECKDTYVKMVNSLKLRFL